MQNIISPSVLKGTGPMVKQPTQETNNSLESRKVHEIMKMG